MKQFKFFGDYQPIDGKIAFLFREAFRDHPRYKYNRVYTLNDGGIFTMIIDTEKNKFYHISVVKKTRRPASEKVKDEVKKEILQIFFNWCIENEVFSKVEIDTLTSFSKGGVINIKDEGLIAIDIIAKAKMPR